MLEPIIKLEDKLSIYAQTEQGDEVLLADGTRLISLIGQELGDLAMQDAEDEVRKANAATVDRLEIFAGEILNLVQLYKELPARMNEKK